MADFIQKKSHQVVEKTRQVSVIGQNNPNIGHFWRNVISGSSNPKGEESKSGKEIRPSCQAC
jgi:hypothetical protein